jgi:hypothetical protein
MVFYLVSPVMQGRLAGMIDCNPCKIPMEPKIKLSKESTSPLVDITLYKSLVGSLKILGKYHT